MKIVCTYRKIRWTREMNNLETITVPNGLKIG